MNPRPAGRVSIPQGPCSLGGNVGGSIPLPAPGHHSPPAPPRSVRPMGGGPKGASLGALVSCGLRSGPPIPWCPTVRRTEPATHLLCLRGATYNATPTSQTHHNYSATTTTTRSITTRKQQRHHSTLIDSESTTRQRRQQPGPAQACTGIKRKSMREQKNKRAIRQDNIREVPTATDVGITTTTRTIREREQREKEKTDSVYKLRSALPQ